MAICTRRLDKFWHKGKTWTVDPRLREFRHIIYGQPLEFVPFESEQGLDLLEAFRTERTRSLGEDLK